LDVRPTGAGPLDWGACHAGPPATLFERLQPEDRYLIQSQRLRLKSHLFWT
jgi:hypothetical protein